MTNSNSTSRAEPWSIRRLVVWATEDFKSRGFDSPRLDAELLIGHVLGKTRIEIILDGERPLDQDELERFKELAKRRRAGEPTSYLVGNREFYGTAFEVNSNVLIPRPDTEILVEVALERTQSVESGGMALDLCTGSGCVAIAFALARREWTVTGIDISAAAIEVAQRNANKLGLGASIRFATGDLFDGMLQAAQAMDNGGLASPLSLVTANPPYIPSDVIPSLDVGIRDYEPRLALDGGPDGLNVAKRIIATAPQWLAAGGVLALEIGYDQAPAVSELMQAAGFTEVQVKRDYGGHERVVSGIRG
ncbi:MAG TPA: peptide chain release factor N(5)-glutamine methyltransferase [Polyangiaceae bacterium]